MSSLSFRIPPRADTVRAMITFIGTVLVLASCGPGMEQEDEGGAMVAVADPDDSPVDPSDFDNIATATPGEPSPPDGTVTQELTPLRSVAEWEKLFLDIWYTEHTSSFLPKSRSRDSWQYYNLSYGIDGNTAMYRATGKTQYLDRALLYVNNVVAQARASRLIATSQFKDNYLGWPSFFAGGAGNPPHRGQEIALNETYCWRYVTRMLRVIRETPALYNNPTYRAQYNQLLAFTEKHIFEKWYRRGANSYLYRSRTHMSSHTAYIAMDLYRMTTDPTRKALYLSVFNNINRDMPNFPSSLRNQMVKNAGKPAAYFWNSIWGSYARPGQDVNHGNGVIAFIVEAHDAGMDWTDADVCALAATLGTVIWPSAGRYGYYVDGSGAGAGWFPDGFMKLGRYSPTIQRRLETHTGGGYKNTQYNGNGALNARLLPELRRCP